MSRGPHIEIVRTADEQFHARVVAGNGEIVATTEVYTRRVTAIRGVERLARTFVVEGSVKVVGTGRGDAPALCVEQIGGLLVVEIREIDQR